MFCHKRRVGNEFHDVKVVAKCIVYKNIEIFRKHFCLLLRVNALGHNRKKLRECKSHSLTKLILSPQTKFVPHHMPLVIHDIRACHPTLQIMTEIELLTKCTVVSNFTMTSAYNRENWIILIRRCPKILSNVVRFQVTREVTVGDAISKLCHIHYVWPPLVVLPAGHGMLGNASLWHTRVRIVQIPAFGAVPALSPFLNIVLSSRMI
mmetsp:Transcript_11896/g.17086  ORF Transcript_11896/g.17086 Transcript_11896/m.17086 type:complete len:207 (-) Transcript_11896:24-644(-)